MIAQLILRRANVSRKGGHWKSEDYDVFDDERDVGRIYRVPLPRPADDARQHARGRCARFR
jgi:hypothetical protein